MLKLIDFQLITCISLSILPLILTYIKTNQFKKLNNQLLTNNNNKHIFYKFIFITYKNRVCGSHLNRRQICTTRCSYRYLKNIVNLINAAKRTISICMYHLTIEDISNALIEAHKRNVLVRFICDKEMHNCTASKWDAIKNAGLHTKLQASSQNLMHHKFMLIDEKDPIHQKVLFGSMNYTLQGIINNWENIIYTNNEEIISRFSEEFEDLWNYFLV